MTTPGTRAQAGRLLVSHGMSEADAEAILRSFTAADLDIVKREPAPVPWTGEKAAEETKQQAIAAMRAITKGARP